MPLSLLACRVVESEQHRFADAEPRAGQAELFDAQRTQVLDRLNRWMCLAGFAVRGTGERDAHTPFAEVREHAAVEDLVGGMGQYD